MHGMTELDVVSEVDYQLRRHGSLGPSFTTSLYSSGPHHPPLFGQRRVTWKRALTPPVSILFDFGAIWNGYCYDYGRTLFFGEPDELLRRARRGLAGDLRPRDGVAKPPFLTASDETVLRDGMLFTVEPSITKFDTFSVRIEDVVAVRATVGEPLTTGFRELLVVD